MNFKMKPTFVDSHEGHGWFFFPFSLKTQSFCLFFPLG